jgi:hypothetical protein
LDKKAELLINVLKTYSKYIERKTKFKITDVTKVCSKILTDRNLSIDEALRQLENSFKTDSATDNKGQLMNDGLTPLKTISAMFDNKWSEDILKKGSSKEKISFIARPLIPITGTVITFILSQLGVRFDQILRSSVGMN